MNGIDCKRCGTCCVEPIIPVNSKEIKKLLKVTGLPAQKIVRFLSFDVVEWPWESEDWIELGPGRRLMVLRKLNKRCMFLSKSGCTIYDHRPKVCRVFPVDFQFTEDLSEMDTEIQDRVDSCRAEVSKNPQNNEKLVKIGRALFCEDLEYQKEVAKWNRTSPRGTIAEYLTFMNLTEES